MYFKGLPEEYSILQKTINGVLKFFVIRGLFFADNEVLGKNRGKPHAVNFIFNEEKEPFSFNTWDEAAEFCRKEAAKKGLATH